MIGQLIWSKNRPAQLELLLRSQKEFVTGIETTIVIYQAQGAVFKDGYARCRGLHSDVLWLKETNFHNQVIQCLANSLTQEYVLGNSDDNVWINELDLTPMIFEPWVSGFSLRLNPAVSYCQPAKIGIAPPDFFVDRSFERAAGAPVGEEPALEGYQSFLDARQGHAQTTVGLHPGDIKEIKEHGPFPGLIFRWDQSDPRGCWGYPNPCDSNVYRRQWWVDLIKDGVFADPGSLENWMNTHRDKERPYMRCYDRSRLVNICANTVQNGSSNPSLGWSPELLARRFNQGERICLEPFRHMRAIQCHVLANFQWEKP
jgi:hypothetical protein